MTAPWSDDGLCPRCGYAHCVCEDEDAGWVTRRESADALWDANEPDDPTPTESTDAK